jgi:hypothetical protein
MSQAGLAGLLTTLRRAAARLATRTRARTILIVETTTKTAS